MPDTILRHVPGMRTASPVPERNAATLEVDAFPGQFVSAASLALSIGAAAHWPALRKNGATRTISNKAAATTMSFFIRMRISVTLKRMEAGKTNVSFAEGLDYLQAADTEVASLGFPEPLSELLPDVGGFAFLPNPAAHFLYGPAVSHFIYRNAGTTWHYHPVDETLMCQVIGAKKIGLLSARTRFQKNPAQRSVSGRLL